MYGPLYDGWYEPDCFFFLFCERGNPLIWFLPSYNPSLWSSLTVIVSTCTWRRGQSNSLKWSFYFPYFWGGKEGEGGANSQIVFSRRCFFVWMIQVQEHYTGLKDVLSLLTNDVSKLTTTCAISSFLVILPHQTVRFAYVFLDWRKTKSMLKHISTVLIIFIKFRLSIKKWERENLLSIFYRFQGKFKISPQILARRFPDYTRVLGDPFQSKLENLNPPLSPYFMKFPA